MKNKNKSDINPDIIDKINNSSASENVKECLKELIEFEYDKIDNYGIKFKDTYLDTIEKWKKDDGEGI
ncbi:MAG: hypothetical protein IJ287_05190 [Methanobrevibacter sp.]|nr:hypothetical protein [Methanobrevibacter sp.]